MSGRKDVVIAETFARIREEMLIRLFIEKTPVEQWQGLCDEYLSKYPEISLFEQIFRELVDQLRINRENIAKIWPENSIPNCYVFASKQGPAKIEADEEGSKHIFTLLFDSMPSGHVLAIRGEISIVLIVADYVDFKKAAQLTDKQVEYAHPCGTVLYPKGLPVILLYQDPLQDEWSFVMTRRHEGEHIKTLGLQSFRRVFADKKDASESALAVMCEKMRKLERNTSLIETQAKGELLSFFTQLEMCDEVLRTMDGDQKEKMADRLEVDAQRDLIALREQFISENSGYYIEYRTKFNPSNEEKARYERHVREGVEAFAELRNIYRSEEIENFDRMAINVLEQFPLHRWSAVVRLISMRSK